MFPITNGDTSGCVKLRKGEETSRVESSREIVVTKGHLRGLFFFGGGYVKISVQDGLMMMMMMMMMMMKPTIHLRLTTQSNVRMFCILRT